MAAEPGETRADDPWVYATLRFSSRVHRIIRPESQPDEPLSGHPKPANENEVWDVDRDEGTVAFVGMSNVLSEEKRQQVIALGRLGWPLRRIELETGVRRETAGCYLKAAGIAVRPPGAWGRRPPATPANEVTTGSDAAQLAPVNPNPNSDPNPTPENL